MSKWIDEAAEERAKTHDEYLKILVWGPGDPGATASDDAKRGYQKRLQIRDVLRVEFPKAEVYFSEDDEMIKLAEGLGGQLRKEAAQASTADLVIMLDTSRGVDLELDHFVPTYAWFSRKVHVFLPEKYVSSTGLVKEVFNYLHPYQVQGFTDAEFASCAVATKKAVQVAETFALLKRLGAK